MGWRERRHSVQAAKYDDALFGPINAIFKTADSNEMRLLNKIWPVALQTFCFRDTQMSSWCRFIRSSHLIVSREWKKECSCCRCCLSSWSTLNHKPGQQTAVTPPTNFYRYFLLFTARRWWKACGPPRWKTLWSNGTAADILLASHWSNLQSDWFRLMPTCPAETHKLRPPREQFRFCLLLLFQSFALHTAMTW